MHASVFRSPVGPLTLVTDDAGALVELWLSERAGASPEIHPTAVEVARQLTEYFAGERRTFELQVKPSGTEFQQAVWHELTKIPYGETRSYGDIARAIGQPKGAQAVGAANGANPIAIVIPCHRVIGSDGSLTGFGGGLEMKEKLLRVEGAISGSLF